MKERPILFSGPMVRALLEDRKTQIRRIIKGAENFSAITDFTPWFVDAQRQVRDSGMPLWVSYEPDGTCREWGCPYGQAGDRLWVRETWTRIWERSDGQRFTEAPGRFRRTWIEYAATCEDCPPRWRPSIHMPRAYSRITLEIVDVRAQRLQDISEEDAIAEGLIYRQSTPDYPIGSNIPNGKWYFGLPEPCGDGEIMVFSEDYKSKYAELWDSINAERGHPWANNFWVWVVTFRRIEPEGK